MGVFRNRTGKRECEARGDALETVGERLSTWISNFFSGARQVGAPGPKEIKLSECETTQSQSHERKTG